MKKIVELLLTATAGFSFEDISKALNLMTKNDKLQLKTDLELLIKYHLVQINFKKKYFILPNAKIDFGIIKINKKGHFFVKSILNPEQKYELYDHQKMSFFIDDVVIVKIKSHRFGNLAKIIEIVGYGHYKLIGTIYIERNRFLFRVHNPSLQHFKFHFPLNFDYEHETVYKFAFAALKNQTIFMKYPEVIGSLSETGIDVLAALSKYDFPIEFSNRELKQAKLIPHSVLSADKKNRRDLTHLPFITIDGTDAKDFDDAIYVTPVRGGYTLYVAIADVSYYVQENDSVDQAALVRANSIYLVDRVIPMLPFSLSNEICSLKPNVERLVLVCEMEIDQTGKTRKKQIYEAVIKSQKRCTYDEVNAFLNTKTWNATPIIKTMLQHAFALYEILRDYKLQQGMLDFNIPEDKIIIDDHGNPLDIVLKVQDHAEKLIESFMIRANETVANMLFDKTLPCIYRVHPAPKFEQNLQLQQFLQLSKLPPENIPKTGKDLQQLIIKVQNHPLFTVLASLLLRALAKATYTISPNPHFGLSSIHYSHFTSPIRRYPDLLLHRLIKIFLLQKNTKTSIIAHYKTVIANVARISNEKELITLECEREIKQMKKTEYMQQYLGKIFIGTITWITNFGIFVQIEKNIEGLILLRDFKDDFYLFNEQKMLLQGQRNHLTFQLGDQIKVKLKAANKETNAIDFVFIASVK